MQLDLHGNPISKLQSAQMIAHRLKNHKIKLYKPCAVDGCNLQTLNKPWNHYCWQHQIDMYAYNQVLFVNKTNQMLERVIENPCSAE